MDQTILLLTLAIAAEEAGGIPPVDRPAPSFDLPAEERLNAAMGLLGINYATLSDEAGHA